MRILVKLQDFTSQELLDAACAINGDGFSDVAPHIHEGLGSAILTELDLRQPKVSTWFVCDGRIGRLDLSLLRPQPQSGIIRERVRPASEVHVTHVHIPSEDAQTAMTTVLAEANEARTWAMAHSLPQSTLRLLGLVLGAIILQAH